MGIKKQAIFLTWAVLGTLLVLSACGASASAGGTPGAAPDSVRILIDAPSPTSPGTKPVVTLRDAALVQRLYATIYALPAMPGNQMCTLERGPHYTLTFQQSTATLVTVQANRDGCHPVTIAGATPVRQGTSAFWEQLDQAISVATPPLNPDRLAIAFTPHAGQAPQTAQIASAATARRLYGAILALQPASTAQYCPATSMPTYQFVFFAGDQKAPAFTNDTCQTVSVQGGYQWRGGVFAINDQFRSLLRSVLAGANFAPARPDQLALYVTKVQTSSYQVNVSDTQLMLAMYDRVFALSATAPQPGCPPSADKLAGKGTFATFTFTQWNLQLVQIDTYEGSCSFVELSPAGQWLQADPTFWDLVHRALAE